MLYVVATPIGNLGEMSPRAIDVLKKVHLIAAEDTRVTRKLTVSFGINTPLTSYHQHNENSKGEAIVDRMLNEGIDVALVSDAGTPSISDPGSKLAELAIRSGIQVVSVAGPCAVAAAISVSGFRIDEFSFYGFLPRTPGPLRKKLNDISKKSDIAVVYESPNRVIHLVKVIVDEMPYATLSISCDLTKLHEKTLRGSPAEILYLLENNPKTAKGEYCICMDLRAKPAFDVQAIPSASLEGRLFDGLLAGKSLRDAMAEMIECGEKKNMVYAASLRVKKAIEALQDSPVK